MSNASDLNEQLLASWQQEQSELKKKQILVDTEPWQLNRNVFGDCNVVSDTLTYNNESLRYVAGLDISFVKEQATACSGLFVFDLSDNMKLVYQDLDHELIQMDQPYISGYLAYREAPFLLSKLEKLKQTQPHLYPHCIFIDGNGILHQHKFGMACHIGLKSDTPTIGVSKKLCQVFGLENDQLHKEKIKTLKEGEHFELFSNEHNPSLLGYCYRSTTQSTNPIYVSIGHKISWTTCLWILKLVITKYRIPEPIRQADLITREFLRSKNLL